MIPSYSTKFKNKAFFLFTDIHNLLYGWKFKIEIGNIHNSAHHYGVILQSFKNKTLLFYFLKDIKIMGRRFTISFFL